MKNIRLFFVSLFLAAGVSAIAGPPTYEALPSPTPADENHRDLFDYEMDYTFSSHFYDVRGDFGHGDSLYNDFSYAHRFLITGKWYFRAGVEYERFDFGGTNNGLPDHLQTAHALLALEYVVHDHAGAGIEIDPGLFFQNDVHGNDFDIPAKAFVTFPLKKDKIFAVIGVGFALNQNPIVGPGGGIIWLSAKPTPMTAKILSFFSGNVTNALAGISKSLPWTSFWKKSPGSISIPAPA